MHYLVPRPDQQKSDAQAELMVALNERVKQLFEQRPGLQPSEVLNPFNHHLLTELAADPTQDVGYHFAAMGDVHNDTFWLNATLWLTFAGSKSTYLSPKQTFVVCSQLQGRPELVQAIREFAKSQAESLHRAAEVLEAEADGTLDRLFADSRYNHVFDGDIEPMSGVTLYTNTSLVGLHYWLKAMRFPPDQRFEPMEVSPVYAAAATPTAPRPRHLF